MSLDQPEDFVKHQTLTRDAFLAGRLTVSQPRNGFRAGLDSVLLGASVDRGAASLLDLGAGVGTAALVAMAHNPGLSATLVERDPASAALARANCADNGLAGRAEILLLDVTAPGVERARAGVKADAYDAVIANPPFFDRAAGTLAGDAGRAGARHMAAESLDLWIRAAATSAAPGGAVIFIHTVEALPALLSGFERRFGGLTVLPLVPREGEAASRVLVRGIKGSRAPLRLLSPLVLHGEEGRDFMPGVDAIFRGAALLDW